MVKSLSAEMEKMKFEGKQGYKNAQNVENRGNFRDQIISLRYFQENLGTEIGRIRKSILLFKIILWLMRKGRKKNLTLKSIVLEIPPLFPI
jgi:hypothetical protein